MTTTNSDSINFLWNYNEPIEIKTSLHGSITKLANINNHLFVLTSSKSLYEGRIQTIENGKFIEFTPINLTFEPSDITSHNKLLYILTSEGVVQCYNEQLDILDTITLIEDHKCSIGHESGPHQQKIKRFSINQFGSLYVSDSGHLWASGNQAQLGITDSKPKKVEFFSGRYIYDLAIGHHFAIVLISKQYEQEPSDSENVICQVCSTCDHKSPISETVVDLENCSNGKLNITDVAKEFLTKQISRMSSVGEEYLLECSENVSNVATFVYEGVKMVGDSITRHAISTSASGHATDMKEELSISQSTSERDLQDLELQENVVAIQEIGKQLLNREVWMWGNVPPNNNLPIIISSLTNLGIHRLSLELGHVCALTLDGRVFLWGSNLEHEISRENKSEQLVPKPFTCNLDERVVDAIAGSNFTMILTNKCNMTYFGKNSPVFQTIFNKFEFNADPDKVARNFSVSQEYCALSPNPKCEDCFIIKEQSYLEEMLYVVHNPIKILIKNSSDLKNASLYEALCKNYKEMLHFLAANVESLVKFRHGKILLEHIVVLRNFKEFIVIFKNYTDTIANVTSINGFSHLIKSNLTQNNEKSETMATWFHSPLKRLNTYTDFFRKFNIDNHTKWLEFLDYVDVSLKEAIKTRDFWEANVKLMDNLMKPHRRLICDSLKDTLTLQNTGRFSFSNRFLLFNDVFVHLNGSACVKYPLKLLWVEMSDEQLNLKFPEDLLVLAAPDGVTKNNWYHCLQLSIKMALNKDHLNQPPLTRSGAYTFLKGGSLKGACYDGRWFNGKMHGSGKLSWPDGRNYTGEFLNNALSGFGLINIPNVGSYKGEWRDNKQNGYGIFTDTNNDVYKGYFKDGVPHGHGLLRKGTFMANSASLYIGEWIGGKKSGYGVMDEISTGEKYLGHWSECKKNGCGLIVTSEGTYYEGNFSNDTLTGQGIMVLDDGTHYEGEFKSTGVIGGKGTITLTSGHVIEGNMSGNIDDEGGGVKINGGVLRKKKQNEIIFGRLCAAPPKKWRALFTHCNDILGLCDLGMEGDTGKIWQNVAVYLSKRNKDSDKSTFQHSLQNLDVIPPFSKETITAENYKEIKNYLNRAFESDFHPLGSLLNDLCEAYIASYSGKVHAILVNHAILEINDICQRVYDVIVHLFPALPSRDHDNSNNIIVVETDDEHGCETVNYQALLYPIVLPKVYNCLCTLLSLKNEAQERQYKKVLIEWNKLADRSLMTVLSVERKFFNLDRCLNISENSGSFVKAIEALQQLITVFLPKEKLKVIRTTVEKMTPVAKELLGDDYVWNMDDLFPLFLYVVVRARIPHLGAELEFMENFMDRNLENGELGIMFTTLKACYQQILQQDNALSPC
ncbi:hypothetical protein ABEB36_011840 [Hypothenemus hampei]|uniref:VPS9 domain-containing protein n=1 Tax=Hypothenemus hampei TaxID=57062 RepID=A0ABD1EB84_HYPHA